MRKLRKRDANEPRQPTRVVHYALARFDIYVGRGTKWGNPYRIGPDGTRREVIEKFEAYIARRPHLLVALGEIRGKVLGCHCAPSACHGDVLARLADA